ncbi:hypothetical protein TPDSL_17200 [Terrisporobacter petrolearius]|uniref:CAP domain-containing protein n=1 Tax=Terrisporobacter petrolearius TaxID=1460447 RepID=UPI0033663BFA
MKKIISIFLVIFLVFFYNTGYFIEIKDEIQEKFLKNDLDTRVETIDNKETNIKEVYNFKQIKIGDSKDSVIKKINKPNRIDKSEYNFNWYVYNAYKENFVMVGIKNNKVVALFTNNIDSCENEDIYINKDIKYIKENYESLKYKNKGNIKYEISSNNEYSVIYKNKKYITVFYDKFNKNKICAYQIIEKSCEDEIKDIYAPQDKDIEKSFMYQIIDLVNSTRYKYNLNGLYYNEKATICATKHSEDMKDNDFFDHVNLKNKTPFDRMEKEGIDYLSAGENIAAGQTSAIFVHNGLMNSQGHRKNILGNYKYIGVGVVFGGKYKTYYTENFFG